jgi:glycosyltransferase involved in cell wall biosynthesis
MNDKPLVSVLVTSYNRSEYICETIDSILNQTYPNFEIIICDNCSTDDTMDVIKKYAGNSRVRIYQNEENIGQFPNRNKIAGYAKGKYLKYVDSDDLLYPNGLQIMVAAMERFPDAGWGLCNEQDKSRPHPFLLTPKDAYEYHYTVMPIFERSPLGSIIKKAAFEAVGGFRDIKMAGDFEMWHRLACYYPLVIIAPGVAWYREHNSQEMNQYANYILQYDMVRRDYLTSGRNPLIYNERRKIINIQKKRIRKEMIKNFFKFEFENANMLFRLYKKYSVE